MTNMFKSALFAATAAVSLVAVPAMAADAAVLTVDVDQMFQNSAAGKSGSSQLSAKYNPVLQQRQAELNTAITAYNAAVNTLKAATKPGTQPQPTPAFLQARDRVQAAQDAVQEVEQAVNQLAGFVRSQIIDHARPVAEQIRAERKATAVIAKDSALASDPANDITSTLVQRLDSSFTTPSITPPQAAAPSAPSTSSKPTQGR
ncbi:OmpH family outer membrane protein [uncultured Sphingomonas sp.]|uniref:OmpH family outer membrane protein n=1 Tax=uncultured Sphingomonas sp. TaxID=158754 RepID=UPI0026252C93|nr:OmpH family outer membrane protein [uncultured Sphingomonas sp.]